MNVKIGVVDTHLMARIDTKVIRVIYGCKILVGEEVGV